MLYNKTSLVSLILLLISVDCFAILNGKVEQDHPSIRSIHFLKEAPGDPYEEYMVRIGKMSIEETENYNKFNWGTCTGTFISDKILITAYHCVSDILGNFEGKNNIPPLAFKIKNEISIKLDHPLSKASPIARRIILPSRTVGLGPDLNDIALIEFPDNTSQTWIQIAPLEKMGTINEEELITIKGFGMTYIPTSADMYVKKKGAYYSLEEIDALYEKLISLDDSLVERTADLKTSYISKSIQVDRSDSKIYEGLPLKLLFSADIEEGSDPFISYGDSGGPLLNNAGELVAIQSRFITCQEFPKLKTHGFDQKPGDILTIFSVAQDYSICSYDGLLYSEATALTIDLTTYKIIKNYTK